MAALQVIEAQIWRDTLLNMAEDPEAPTPVYPVRGLTLVAGSTPPQYRVFWEHATDANELAYITTHHISGGRERDPSYSDTMWKIVGHTGDMEKAEALANAISLMANRYPISTISGVCAYTWIEEIMPIFDRYQVQNVPFFVVGGIYRLRLNLGVN